MTLIDRSHLHLVEDVVKPQLSIDVSSVTTAQQIHWDGCQVLLGELNTFTSSEAARLTSPLEYLFGRNRVVGCVKKGLIDVKLIHKVEHEVKRAIRRIRAARPNPPPLFPDHILILSFWVLSCIVPFTYTRD